MKKLLYLIFLIPFLGSAQTDTIFVNPGSKVVIIAPEAEEAPPVVKPPSKFMVNVTNDIDHHPNIKGEGARYFWNVGHDLPARGILADGGRMARDHTFTPLIGDTACNGVNYDGTMCDNKTRVNRLYEQFGSVMVVPQMVQGPFKNWLGWPNKYVPPWQWGNTVSERYLKIKEHFKALLWSTDGKITHIQVGNEPWGMTPEEWNIVESARVDAWIEYNIEKGLTREDYASFTPKLITAAMPIGQGLQTSLSFADLANSRYAKYYYAVAVHAYNRTLFGWSSDSSISDNIIDTALEFCKEYMPHCRLWITETGAPNNIVDQHIGYLNNKMDSNPGIEKAVLYNSFNDGTGPTGFGDCFFIDVNGDLTPAAIEYNILTKN